MNRSITVILFFGVFCFCACSKKIVPTATFNTPPKVIVEQPIQKDTVVYTPPSVYKKYEPVYVKPFDEEYKNSFSEIQKRLLQ